MQKSITGISTLLLLLYSIYAAAQTDGAFQQLSLTAGTAQFGKLNPSVPVKAGLGYSGKFNWGFYAAPHFFINFGAAVSSFEESYQYIDYNTAAVSTGKQTLEMFSHMVGAGVCLGNLNTHVMLGADATVNIMFADSNPHYYIGDYRDVGAGVAPHADVSFRIGRRILLGVSAQAMFFPGLNKKENGLTGSYYGGGIHLQLAH